MFKEKEHHVKRSRIDHPAAWRGVAYSHNKVVRASFFVSWKIAQDIAPRTAREKLIKPAAVKMVRILCGNAVANKLVMVLLSNNTIKWRIQVLSEDIMPQTIASVKRSGKFSVQLDEITDIRNDAQLMVSVQYLDTNDYMEQFLFCHSLAKNTTGKQIFKKLN